MRSLVMAGAVLVAALSGCQNETCKPTDIYRLDDQLPGTGRTVGALMAQLAMEREIAIVWIEPPSSGIFPEAHWPTEPDRLFVRATLLTEYFRGRHEYDPLDETCHALPPLAGVRVSLRSESGLIDDEIRGFLELRGEVPMLRFSAYGGIAEFRGAARSYVRELEQLGYDSVITWLLLTFDAAGVLQQVEPTIEATMHREDGERVAMYVPFTTEPTTEAAP